MEKECRTRLLELASLLSGEIVNAWALVRRKEFDDAKWLLYHLHTFACQLCGPMHTNIKQIETLLNIIDRELAIQWLESRIEESVAKFERLKITSMLKLAWPIEARELVTLGKFNDIQRLVVDLHTKSCQVDGPEHARANQTEALLKTIDLELENLRMMKAMVARTESFNTKVKNCKREIRSLKLDLVKLNYYNEDLTIDIGLWLGGVDIGFPCP